ncbi:SDR family NAD(P)-dependent oxidoreductase [Sorangium sp. So ce131]|uniref:SDR family NAD(P)-dependent oxidoreductase n=1 Tax=Sorangium sp. So ce131 TaxID=3133282 RepID=UPI003F5F3C48
MELEGKVIVVTGASSGIGLASARALAREGARVILAARSMDRLSAEAERLRREGGTAMAVEMDVTSDASVEAAVASILERFGRIDVVINNAGNGGRLSYWESTDAAFTRAMFEVHLFGMERVTRAVLPAMRAQGSGTVVNIASTVAWVPMPTAAAYCAAKAAVVAFSEALRGELEGRGVRVIVFGPPHTRTAAGDAWPLEGPRTFAPEWVAEELIRTLRRGRRRFLAGASNRSLLMIQRVSPDLAARIMKDIGLRACSKSLAADRGAAAAPLTSR